MKKPKPSEIDRELERIRKANSGILRPIDVVNAAEDESSALHSCFEWDDSEAAKEYRLWQARRLIRVRVAFDPATQQTARVYVSLHRDRDADSGGYRILTDALADPELRKELLDEALEEMKVFQAKYATIKELAGVFAAMKKVIVKRKSRKMPAMATV